MSIIQDARIQAELQYYKTLHDYLDTLGTTASKGRSQSASAKQLAFEPLRNCTFRAERTRHITRLVQRVNNARQNQITKRAHQLAMALHHEQTAQAQALATPMQEASAECGYTNVVQLNLPDRTHITADDTHGRALVIELRTRPYQPLQLKVETLGFNDHGCANALERFNHALERRGIYLADRSSRRTQTPPAGSHEAVVHS